MPVCSTGATPELRMAHSVLSQMRVQSPASHVLCPSAAEAARKVAHFSREKNKFVGPGFDFSRLHWTSEKQFGRPSRIPLEHFSDFWERQMFKIMIYAELPEYLYDSKSELTVCLKV